MAFFIANLEDPQAQDRNLRRLRVAALKPLGLRLADYDMASLRHQPDPGPDLEDLVPMYSADRCWLCGSPVTDDRGVRVRLVEDPRQDGYAYAVTDAEADELIALGGKDHGFVRIGADCYRRNKADLELYARKP
jgi:hypothetical protein